MRWRIGNSRRVGTLAIVFVLLCSLSIALLSISRSAHADNTDPAHYDNIPGYELSGVGNTYIINNPAYTHVQSYIDQAVVTADGCVHTKSNWDEGGNNWGVYCNGSVEMHNQDNAPSPVDNTTVTINGDTWSLNNGGVQDSNGVQVPNITKATALGVDIPDNHLMVADDGVGQHVIKFYTVSGSPTLVRTFGTVGGIAAGNPGEVTPTKFWGLTGVGTDSSGNIYVAGSLNAAYIRSFTPDGNTLRWQMYGLHFEDSCDFDPGSDGQTIYCNQKVYQMDYSKPAGQQWTLKYYTLNTDAYPSDARAGDGEGSAGFTPFSTWYRTLGGQRFLVTTSQDNSGFYFFKFKSSDGGWIASPSITISSDTLGGYAGDFKVMPNGDIYKASCDKINVLPFQGLDGNGDPTYGTLQQSNVPAPFNCVEELTYDQANDIMYLGGGTPDQPTMGWGNAGPVTARYSHWSNPNQRQLDWQINIPFYHNDDPNVDNRHVPIEFCTAGDYLFISYVDKDASYTAEDGESGATRVYRTGDGSYVGRMVPDGTYGGVQGSWIDESSGAVKAYERADGTYLIIREENWLDKNILYIWKPGGAPPPTPTPSPTPTATPISGEVALNRSGWVASASSTESGGSPSNALDGDLTTRWSSGQDQSNGDWFEVDMQSRQTFNEIVLDATNSPNDYPRGYQVFVSNDGSNWGNAVASGSGSGAVTTMSFGSQTARYIKVVQTGTSSQWWWSIDEFNVYAPSGSTATPTPTATPSPGQLLIAINAGGGAAGNFVADTDVNQGNQYSDTSSSIDTSGVSNPAPQAVWQTCRWNASFTYTIPGLTAGHSYTVKLDWAELTFQASGDRQFNVAINGNSVLSNLDVYATVGYKKAVQRSFSATANSKGQIVISFTRGNADNPFINGIEVYS